MFDFIKSKLLAFIFTKLPKLVYLRNAEAERKEWFCYRYLSKRSSWYSLDWPELEIPKAIPAEIKKNETIFIYWKQGLENAPPLVKKCVESVKKNAKQFNVLLLTEKNVTKYSSLPSFIEEKHQKGIISEALYTDLLRSNLLYRFGGVWCDATCFWTESMYDFITDADLFFFKASLLRRISPIEGSSWFIRAKQGNLLLKKTQCFLFEWFRKNDFTPYYFIFHLTFSVLINIDSECRKIWDEIPYICNMNPHVFYFHFSNKFEEGKYNLLLKSCFIHKLTYKFDPILLQASSKNMLMHFLEEE